MLILGRLFTILIRSCTSLLYKVEPVSSGGESHSQKGIISSIRGEQRVGGGAPAIEAILGIHHAIRVHLTC